MSVHALVKMANDIGRYFASEPKRADAIAGIATHIQRSWDPRMLRQIVAHVAAGGDGLDELPREAVRLLKLPQTQPPQAQPPPPQAPPRAGSGQS